MENILFSFGDIIKSIIKSNDDKIKELKVSMESDYIKSFTNGDSLEIYKLEYINSKLKTIKRSEIEDTISNLEIEIKNSIKEGHIPCVASKITERLEIEAKKQICDIYKMIIRFY